MRYCLALVIVISLSACCANKHEGPDFAEIDQKLREIVKDPRSDDETLLQAISRLGPVTEHPLSWSDVANDPNYSRLHRARAVMALFRRHGERCRNLAELAVILKPMKWLNDEDVHKVVALGGWIPVELRGNDTAFWLEVSPQHRVYVLVLGDISRTDFITAIRGGVVKFKGPEGIIEQIGYNDDYEGWFSPNKDKQIRK